MAAAVLPIKSYAIKSEVKKEINISFTGLILIIKEKKFKCHSPDFPSVLIG